MDVRPLTARVTPPSAPALRSSLARPAEDQAPERPPQPDRAPAAGEAAAATQQDRGFVVHPTARELVFQIVDSTTGDLLAQIPDESVLRARVYAREREARPGTALARFA